MSVNNNYLSNLYLRAIGRQSKLLDIGAGGIGRKLFGSRSSLVSATNRYQLTLPVGLAISSGWLAWIAGQPFFLLALPIAWSLARTRFAAFAAFFGYYATLSTALIGASKEFIGWGWLPAVVAWIAWAAILAAPYGLLRNKQWGFAAALVITAVPPLGLFGWLSPLISAGAFFPGIGLLGIAMTMVMMSFFSHGKRMAVIAGMSLFFLSCLSNFHYKERYVPWGWMPADTSFGKPLNMLDAKDMDMAFARHMTMQSMARTAMKEGMKVVVFPEAVSGEWRPAYGYWWAGLVRALRSSGSTVIIGADVTDGAGGARGVAIAAGKDATSVAARVPMPFSLWRPWSSRSMRANWAADGKAVIDGKVTVFSFCYEDWLVWPMAWTFMLGGNTPTVMVSMANNWMVKGSPVVDMQRMSAELTARLYGMGLVRAVNH